MICGRLKRRISMALCLYGRKEGALAGVWAFGLGGVEYV